MRSTPQLLAQYSDLIKNLTPAELAQPRGVASLTMDKAQAGAREIDMIYAPFDHINRAAKVVIVGMTPGHFQAVNALTAAHKALTAGKSIEAAAESAKVFASFSGEPMRGNLIRMLDRIGVAKMLGLQTTALLWTSESHLVHFTSALRYPVFVDGENWSGQPDMVRTPKLREWLETYTGSELSLLQEAVIVPLGPKVAQAMQHVAGMGMIDASRILNGLPHPSGANAERIAYFMGDKPAHLCSSKTNTATLDLARESLCAKVAQL